LLLYHYSTHVSSDQGYRQVGKRIGHSGIYLLPNLFTTSSLFAAYYSIVASFKHHFITAVVAIFIGMIADGLDGRIARLTNTQTSFGAEYDSLSDMVTFGVAPSLMIYLWNLQFHGKLGWLVAFIYTAAVALRLARFNTQIETADKRYFQGLACPAAAAFIVSWVWVCHQYHFRHYSIAYITMVFCFISSLLMVSNIRYQSFKQIDLRGKISFLSVLMIVITYVAIASNPAIVLFLIFMGYAVSGPIQTLYVRHRVRSMRRKAS
jgi:CDP-diacylglycerol--serine O-phosphatidyltransferase